MTRARILAMSIACVVISSSVISAQDLSRYREFQLGMSLVAVAQQAGITAEARLLHQRPEVIQELTWQPRYPDLADIISSAWEWRRRHPHGYADPL